MEHDDGRLKAAITRWLADQGVATPALAAAEVLHMVRGHGWRPVPALQPPPLTDPAEPVSKPTDKPEVAEALARCAAASERFRATEPNPERTP